MPAGWEAGWQAVPPAPSCQGLAGGFALAILSLKGEPAAPGPASPDCWELRGVSGTPATRSPLAAVRTLCLLSSCWGRGVGAGPAADVRGGGGIPSLDLSLRTCACGLAWRLYASTACSSPSRSSRKWGPGHRFWMWGHSPEWPQAQQELSSKFSRGTRFLSKSRPGALKRPERGSPSPCLCSAHQGLSRTQDLRCLSGCLLAGLLGPPLVALPLGLRRIPFWVMVAPESAPFT